MSDDVCGPSGALKSFGRHVNQDQSRHQDRTRPTPGGSQTNFRSTPAGPSNDAEFRAFASGANLPVQPGAELMAPEFAAQHMAGFHPGMPNQQMGYAGPSPVGPMGMPTVGPVTIPVHGFAHPNAAHASGNWAHEFSSMHSQNQLQNAPTAGYAPNPYGFQGSQQPLMQPLHQPHMQHQHAGFNPGQAYAPMLMQNYSSTLNYQQPVFQPINGYAATHPQSAETPAGATMTVPTVSNGGIGGLTEAELEARFAQLEADYDFENEMDAWMAQYGPTAEERGETVTATGREENVDQILEHLAEELEAHNLDEATSSGGVGISASQTGATAMLAEHQVASLEGEQRPAQSEIAQEQPSEAVAEEKGQEQDGPPTQEQLEQDDLARTAEQIINTLDAHPSERFRESAFVGLMRRIQAREVTVQGDVLLDSATGMPVESTAHVGEQSEAGVGISIPSAGPQQEVA